jgi:hypothetical protein
MLNPRSHPQETAGVKLLFFSIPNDLLLQVGTASLLVGLIGGKAVTEAAKAIGQASEELFRGDRLPVLPFPETETASESNSA